MLLRPRLTLAFLAISVVPIILIGVLTYTYVKEAMEQTIIEGLHEIAELQESNLFLYLDKLKTTTQSFASDGLIREAVASIMADPGNAELLSMLQRHLLNNKLPLNVDLHAMDVVGLDGMIMVSTRTADMGADYSQQPCFRQGMQGIYLGDIHRQHDDILEYKISAPLFSSTRPSELIGVLVNHFSVTSLKNLFSGRHALGLGARTQNRGLGGTGETYLVNSERLMVTDSLFVKDASFNQLVDTYPVTMGVEHQREVQGIWRDYRGVEVVGASMVVDAGEFNWILIAEQDAEEAFASITRLKHVYAAIIVLFSLLAFWFSVLISKKITHPIGVLKRNLEQGGKGRQNAHLTDLTSDDEIGFLARKFDDIQQQKEQLEELSNRDGLTGLFNQCHMREHLEVEFNRSCRYKTPLCCILLDIDYFKLINDTYGHLFGDHVLQGVAEVIVDCCRKSDIMARYGGEEFVILLPNTDLEQARAVAEKLFNTISSVDYCDAGQRISITVSMGIAAFREEQQSYREILAEADEAMYLAKEGGRNRICVFGEE